MRDTLALIEYLNNIKICLKTYIPVFLSWFSFETEDKVINKRI